MEIAHEVCDAPPCFHPDHLERQRRRDNRRKSMLNTHAKRRAKLASMVEELRRAA